MKFLWKTLLRGLSVILPLVATLYLLVWLFESSESMVKRLLTLFIPEEYYVPGMGIVLLLAALFVVGLLMYSWVIRKLVSGVDYLFGKIPLVSSIYSPMRDLMGILKGDFASQLGRPVMIQIPGTQMEMIGFITARDLGDLPDGMAKEDHVVVFAQWSYQLGGYCFIVPRDSVREIDMRTEDALRWVITAGLSKPGNR